LDTGSAETVFAVDKVLNLGLRYEAQDGVHPIRGVGGGIELVFTKRWTAIEIEVGAMDCGFEIQGILRMDFLVRAGADVDLAQLEMRSRP
jgi:hypothetical protein